MVEAEVGGPRDFKRWRHGVLAASLLAILVAPMITAQGPRDERVTLSVLHGLSTNNLPLFVGVKKGFFADEGLDLLLKPEISSPRNLELLHLGQIQMAGVGAIPSIIGASRGVRVVVIAENGGYGKHNPQQAIAVRKDSPIAGLHDLKGKTLALTGIGSHGDMTLKMDILPRAGLTSRELRLVELPVAQMEAALVSRTLDAALVNDPWATRITLNPELEILSWLEETIPDEGYVLSLLLMQSKYAAANPSVVERFRRAYARAVNETKQQPSVALALSSEFLKLPQAILEKTRLLDWPTDGRVRVDLLRAASTRMKLLGIISREPDLTHLVWPSAVYRP